jgi:hypothetical protein
MKKRRWITHPVLSFVDWYVRNYHSKDYIHRDMIKDEISKRLGQLEQRLMAAWQESEEALEHRLRLEFQIIEDGYVAEIQRLEARDKRRQKWLKNVTDLYYKEKGWAQRLAVVTAKHRHNGKELMSSIGEFMGDLECIGREACSVDEEVSSEDLRVLEEPK